MKSRVLFCAIFVACALGFVFASAPRVSAQPLPTSTVTPTPPPWLFTVTPLPTSGVPQPTLSPTRRITTAPATTATATLVPTGGATLSATLTPLATATFEAPTTPTVAPTAPRYALSLDAKVLAVDSLRARRYGGGAIKVTRVLSDNGAFQRVLFEYPSDGLKITGMMNIPRGEGPFPVVVLNHGGFKASEYKSGDGTNFAADAFARRGYLTLASDYRCYGGSQCASNPLHVGYAIDVLNLIALVPTLPYADPARVGIWGHSMGGGITARVITVNDSIKVAAFYAAVSADDEVHYCWLTGCKPSLALPIYPTPQKTTELDTDFATGAETNGASSRDALSRLREIFVRSSPFRHLQYVSARVIVHHGEKDDVVPLQWSIDLADALNARGKPAELYTYPGEGHVFVGVQWRIFMERTMAFFDKSLAPRQEPMTAEARVLKRESAILESND